MRLRRLPIRDTLIATIGERAMRLEDVTQSIAKQGHAKALLQDIRDELRSLKRACIIAESADGYRSTRRFA